MSNLSKFVIRRGRLRFAPEIEKDIIRKVLAETGFKNGTSEVKSLIEYSLQPHVYCSIGPEIRVHRDGVPNDYQAITIDLRDYPDGVDETCDDATHTPIDLRWEEGGGCLDSGTPYRYLMCSKCGKNLNGSIRTVSRRRHLTVWAIVAMVAVAIAVAIAA